MFNVLVPLHTRGAITLPGTTVAAARAGGGEQLRSAGCCASSDGGREKPTPADRRACAVCKFVATLTPATPPPVPDWVIVLLEVERAIVPVVPDLVPVRSPRESRGPPTVV